MKIYRICGYGSGRSELVVKLVEEFAFFGIRTAVIKHAHKPFDMDKLGSDTWNLRQSGCAQTLIAHRDRWGLLCDTPNMGDPDPIALTRHLVPCDLVLAVGFDHVPLPGLEVRRVNDTSEPIYRRDHNLDTVVGDHTAASDVKYGFTRDHIETIVAHILQKAVPVPA